MSFPRSGRSRGRGQALVEMALVLPIMLVVLFGIIDLGFVFYKYLNINIGVREGLRLAGMNMPIGTLNTADYRDRIKDEVTNNAVGVGLTRPQVVLTIANPSGVDPFPRVTITVTHQHQFLTPFVLAGLGQLQSSMSASITTWTTNATPRFIAG